MYVELRGPCHNNYFLANFKQTNLYIRSDIFGVKFMFL